jgi:hypothetical protein
MMKDDVLNNVPLEQDMVELARMGLAARLRRAQNRRWRIEQAKQDLERLEALNERAVGKLGNPDQLQRERREIQEEYRRQMRELQTRLGVR